METWKPARPKPAWNPAQKWVRPADTGRATGRRNGYAGRLSGHPGADRRNGYGAETGTLTRLARRIQSPRRNGYVLRPRGAETGTVRQAERLQAARQRTCFCVDNRLAAVLSTGFWPEPARPPRIRAPTSQKQVRMAVRALWKSLWTRQVIPAESGSRRAQIRVRMAADTGSALR
jgi:hypothetical protein